MKPTDDYKPNDYTLERWLTALLALLFLLPWIANGQELPKTKLNDVEGAALLLKTGTPGVYALAPTVSTDVQIRVAGPVVRTRVSQTFRNSTGQCVEGVYVYPLPEMSAVDSLKMTVGSRLVVGEIREKEEAARQYRHARSEGRKAALVEQHRPNVFTTSVASLMPDEEAVIEIEYQETARFENGEFRVRFPMIVAPRYNPPGGPQFLLASLFPISLPRTEFNLTVDLQPGHSVRTIRTPHHRLSQQTLGNNHYQLLLDQSDVPLDSDFELVWQPDLGSAPEASVVTERIGDQTFALILVTPPAGMAVALPRETVFIIDSSGSMEGRSMEQAKEALLLALDDLRSGDRFNIIDFDSEARALFEGSQVVDGSSVGIARTFVRGLTADGGTEMLGALRLALGATAASTNEVRQVIFMTDGQVGNEQQLFEYIHKHLGDSRLFTVGIGSAPNSHFMRNAARFGRGTFTYIGDLTQVKERMGELFVKLSSPAMTGIEVQVDDPTAEMWPARAPDLYSGEPLLLTVRVVDPSAPIVIRGRLGNESWSRELELPAPSELSGVDKLWARYKIESAMDRLSEGVDPHVIRGEVVPVALRHQLVSQYTSLVAIDQTPLGLTGVSCQAAPNPTRNGGVDQPVGELPQTATPARLLMLVGVLLIAIFALVGARS